MQPAVQAGGPPACPLNGHDSSSKQQQQQAQKPEAEHPAYSVSVAKSKKRERSNSNHHHHHYSTESSAKLDDSGESKRLRRERTSNSSSNSNGIILPKIEDSASILDKNGGLVSVVGVDRLYHQMQHSESSMKLLGRTSLAGAVAATERDDCLGRFVQLGGLNLFNDWLQEVHRGKLGDVSSCKDPDKVAEDLLLTILRALERLPVDLEILKSCHAGRSVKNLRAHKNPEIQKKAKKLVDAWKKKVVGAQELRPPADLSKTLCWPHGGGGAVGGGGGVRSSMSHGASAKPKGATGSNSTAISNSNSNTGSDVLGKSVPPISGSCPPSPTATFRDNNHPPSSQMQSGGTGPAPDPAYPSASAAPSVPDEKSSNVWSNGSGKSSATAMNPPFSKSVSLRSSGPAKGAAAAGVNGTVKDFGSLKPHGWAGSRGVTAAAASASSEKVIPSAVSEKTSTNPNPQVESVKMEASSNQRIIVRLPNPGKGPLISPSEGGGGGPSATNSRGSPSRRNSSSPPAHESLEGKSWSPSVSRVEDGRPSSVSAKQGVTAGHDASDAGGDLEGAYRPSEPECQSSESQLSLTSSQAKSVDNGGLEAPKKQQQKMERVIVMANAAEDTGISLLACIAADESLKSEKDASAKNRNYSKDVAEISEKENGSADTAKLKRGSFGSMQGHVVDESGEFAKTEAVSAVGVTKLEDDAMESAKSDSPQKDLSSSSPGNIRAEHGLEDWAGDPSGGHGRSTAADKNDNELGSDSGTEPVFKFPEEDALELAVQVAKEVEQEMETYEKNTQTTAEAKDTTDAARDSAATVSLDTKPEDEKTDQAKQTQIGDSELGNSGLERSDPTAEQIHTSPSSATAPSEVSTPVNSIQNSRAATPERAAENNATCTEPEAPDRGGHCFDLNEGVMLDENNPAESNGVCYPVTRIPVIPIASHPMAVAVPPSLSTPIVVASVKGAFVTVPSPPKDRCEPGWRGTAATSAFRPAEPRRATPEKVAAQPSDAAEQRNADKSLDRVTEDVAGGQASEEGRKDALPDSCSAKASQPPLLDFDLNVADESLLQEEGAAVPNPVNESVNAITQSNGCSSVKFDLDLNRADETEENATGLPSSDHMFKSESKPVGSSSEPKPKHNFDLNDGPSMEDPCPGDDSTAFQGSILRHGGPQECAAVSFKMPAEMASMANWSQTAGGPMSAMAMPAFPSVRPENTFPVAVPQTFFSMGQAISPFHSDVYRPPHGFSAPTAAGAAPFSYPAQSPVFPYTGYPFGFSSASFPAATGSFLDATGSHPFNPAASQMLTSATMLPPHLRPPYVVGLTKIPAPTNNDRPWSRHGLDLNAGPDAMDVDNRDDRTSSRFMAALEGPWLADRHSSVTSESLKRKEPEGGWEFNNRFGLKQESRR